MSLSRFVLPFADVGSGVRPSANAKLFFYATGTDTPKDTYNCTDGTTANANPVIADLRGIFPDIFVKGIYKVILQDNNGTQIWEADPVTQVDTFEGATEAELEAFRASGDAAIDDFNSSGSIAISDFLVSSDDSITQAIDSVLQSIDGVVEQGVDQDFGFITQPVDQIIDYGSLV